MEEKIYEALDSLDTEQTEKLLDREMKMLLNSRSLRHIKNSVYKKAGLKRKGKILKKAAVIAAAAAALFVLSISLSGFDNIANAFGKLFGFIPGYGIVENNSSILYVAEGKNLKTGNEKADLTVKSIIAGKDNISLYFNIDRKGDVESNGIEDKKEKLKELENGRGGLAELGITLEAGGKQYPAGSSVMGSGGKTYNVGMDFAMGEEQINTDTVYTLKCSKYALSLDFRLKTPDSYDSLREIGSTDTHNDISITAVSDIMDNKLVVDLYAINKSRYSIKSFTGEYGKGYEGKELYLSTSRGLRKYTTPGSYMGTNARFYFDWEAEDLNRVLNIPYLLVQSAESRFVSLKIPREGGKLTLNKRVEFDASALIITEVERIKPTASGNGSLRIYFDFENKEKNRILCDADFVRTNLFGMTQSGGYSYSRQVNDNGIVQWVDYNLEKEENENLRLKVCNPRYFLLENYRLELN